MKSVLAIVALALAALVVEERARQVAGEAQNAYGEAVEQARGATKTLSRNVKQRPLPAILKAAGVGYVLAMFMPRR
jgi:ElaB/YqjD/DUF883 family membrane-anchored ribosome-binding protein